MADREDIQKELTVLKSDISELKVHLGDLARTMKDVARSEGDETRARFEAEAQSMLERLRGAVDEARGQGRRAYEAVEHQIEERPLVSMVAAFGIGLLLGKLLDRR